MDAGRIDQHSPIETTGELFSDGRCIELILDTETGQLNLLLSDGETCAAAPRAEDMGRVYVPANLSPSLLRAVMWPTKSTPYGSTNQLFRAVQEPFTNQGFPTEVALRSTHFVFSTVPNLLFRYEEAHVCGGKGSVNPGGKYGVFGLTLWYFRIVGLKLKAVAKNTHGISIPIGGLLLSAVVWMHIEYTNSMDPEPA